MAEYTRMGPQGRINQLKDFNRRLVMTQESMAVLAKWQMKLGENLVEVPGRQLAFESIKFGNNAE